MESKYKLFFDRLNRPPRASRSEYHVFVDFMEMLCLVNKDGFISASSFIKRIKKRDRISEEDMQEDEVVEEFGDQNDVLNDSDNKYADDCFALLESRKIVYGKFYPFEVDIASKKLLLKKNITTNRQVYLSLLLSSNLFYCEKFSAVLTSSFEHLSMRVLSEIMPLKSKEVLLIGSSNLEGNSMEGINLFFEKVTKLAEMLNERVEIKKEEISPHNTGDGGLDIVAWIKTGDDNPHRPLFFAQCACTPEWVLKQSTSRYENWSNFLTLKTYPLNFIFIPYSYRKSTGEWHNRTKIQKSILFDRQRIIHFIKQNTNQIKGLRSLGAVKALINHKEELY